MTKYIKFSELKKISSKIKKNGLKVGLAHGKFDMFHYGHFEHLYKAKSFCDKLIVSITSKKKVKDSKIFFNDEIRIKRLKKMRIADYVVIVPFSFGSHGYLIERRIYYFDVLQIVIINVMP